MEICEYDELQYKNIRTGDIALTQKNDFPSTLISYFIFSNFQHSAILAWVDGNKYNKNGKVDFVPYNRGNDILTCLHITKRKQLDTLINEKKRGLVLLKWDEYKSDMLLTMWLRKINRNIDDEIATQSFKKFLMLNHSIIEYEHDYKSILGVSINAPYRPYEHRMICTTMVCEYLKEAYGYPFLLSENGLYFDEPEETDYKPDFKLPSRPFETYRAFDFTPECNQSPVFENDMETIYGKNVKSTYILKHPFTVLLLTFLFFYVLVVQGYFIFKTLGKKLDMHDFLYKFCRASSNFASVPGFIVILTIGICSLYYTICKICR